MPRQSRVDAPGALHHIIARGINRKKIFRDDKDRDNFLERLGDILVESQTPCFACGCENLSLPCMPETARCPHAVGSHIRYHHRFCNGLDKVGYLCKKNIWFEIVALARNEGRAYDFKRNPILYLRMGFIFLGLITIRNHNKGRICDLEWISHHNLPPGVEYITASWHA